MYVWDGTQASAVGATDGTVFALLLTSDGQLVAGGGFDEIGGVVSPNVALYSPTSVSSDPPPVETTFAVYPNPTVGAAQIRTAVGGRAEVLDALGRRLWSGDVAPGTTALPTARLAPGVYVVRLVAGDAMASQRLVIGR